MNRRTFTGALSGALAALGFPRISAEAATPPAPTPPSADDKRERALRAAEECHKPGEVKPFIPRGVYRGPALSATGMIVFMAVDHYHCAIARVEVEPGDDDTGVVRDLWRRLDTADPEHARPRRKITA